MNISGAAKEVFQTLLQYNYQLKLYDDDGMVVAEPAEARRMFASAPNLLVSLVDADDDSKITLMFGKSTHANDIDGLMQALRSAATKYNFTFEPKQYGKEIDAKDYQHLVSVSESMKDNTMRLIEGMFGTSKKSYLQLDNAKLIVHHTRRVDGHPNARARHIDSIFVESAKGQRVQFPTANLMQAMRLAQHISAGGLFDDKIGKGIVETALPRQSDGTPVFVENNPVIREFIDWADAFVPERALAESNNPDDPYEGNYYKAVEMALNDFDPREFLNSDEWENTLGGREPNGEESEIPKSEVMSALEAYLTHYIRLHSPDVDENFSGDVDDTAAQVLPQVVSAMQQSGFSIADDAPQQMTDDMAGGEDEVLTREDVLLPSKNQGASLSREVGKAVVHDDPAHPDEEHAPDQSYISRLQALSGMRSGQRY